MKNNPRDPLLPLNDPHREGMYPSLSALSFDYMAARTNVYCTSEADGTNKPHVRDGWRDKWGDHNIKPKEGKENEDGRRTD